MISPASSQLAERFDIHSSVLIAMITSVFVLAYGRKFHSRRRQPLLIARLRHRHHSHWALISWSAQRNIWTLARVLQLADLWFLGICFRLSTR
jgi:hypothetical protein